MGICSCPHSANEMNHMVGLIPGWIQQREYSLPSQDKIVVDLMLVDVVLLRAVEVRGVTLLHCGGQRYRFYCFLRHRRQKR